MADQLSAAYEEPYLGTPPGTRPLLQRRTHQRTVHGYTSAPGFELVTAHHGDELAGYIFGYALSATSRWWQGLINPDPDDFTTESGDRTFAINELHVRAQWRGQGVASRLHRELLDHRPEKRITILVRPDNPARATYLHWGYQVAGRLQPYPDSPVYDALILDLSRARQPLLLEGVDDAGENCGSERRRTVRTFAPAVHASERDDGVAHLMQGGGTR